MPNSVSMEELVRTQVWDRFVEIANARFGRFAADPYDFTISEENFRLDFAVALATQTDYPHKVFAEYPCDIVSSQKLDLFVDEAPGLMFEFKFFRPMPSGLNPPMTQHLGSLWADMIKLGALCREPRQKFLVVFMDERFRRYFRKQRVVPMEPGEDSSQRFHVGAASKTVRDTVAKRLPHVQVPEIVSVHLSCLRSCKVGAFTGYLIRVA